jgi:hypothetical protein
MASIKRIPVNIPITEPATRILFKAYEMRSGTEYKQVRKVTEITSSQHDISDDGKKKKE